MSADPQPAGARVNWLTDDTGKRSSMRLLSAVALVAAVALAFLDLFGIGEVDSEIVLYFLVAAFAPKAVQKFAERR